MDDFTAWVTGPTARSTRKGIEAIIDEALDWERRSGATFEADKTAVIHFTRKAYKADSEPFIIKGQSVEPKSHVKVLGVVMDTKLRYKEHIARAASKGLKAAMELKRLRGLSPLTARQLFTSMVAPVVDYASNVWMHECKWKAAPAINRVQSIGAQAIVGTFSTVATRIAEAEAHIPTAQDRFWKRAIKMWTDIHTLPKTNPLRDVTSRMRKFRRSYRSPFYQVADLLEEVPLESLETVNPFVLAPWEERLDTTVDETATSQMETGWAVRIAVSSSGRNNMVGMGGVVRIPLSMRGGPRDETFKMTLGPRTEQNPYSAELAAVGHALRLLRKVRHRRIILATSNKAAVLTLKNPRQQSGQQYVSEAYDAIQAARDAGNMISVVWIPTSAENDLLKIAKDKAREATQQNATQQAQEPGMRSTTLRVARAKRGSAKSLPEKVGRHSKRVDTALPGKPTRLLYDRLSRKEAGVLAQLRTEF